MAKRKTQRKFRSPTAKDRRITCGYRRAQYRWITLADVVGQLAKLTELKTSSAKADETADHLFAQIGRALTTPPLATDKDECTQGWHPSGPHRQWTDEDDELAYRVQLDAYAASALLHVKKTNDIENRLREAAGRRT